MKKISLLLSLLAFSMVASAGELSAPTTEGVHAPLWNCALTFKAKGGGLRFLIGKFTLKGKGKISCVDVAGNEEVIPVRVRMGGTPVALSAGIGYLEMVGIATGIGLAGSPEDLLGGYLVGGVKGAFAVGAGAQVALHGADHALTIDASLQAIRGLGLNIGLDYVEIIDARK